jgi:NAD(P)H-nitrite reductase large subunit
MSEPKHIVIIGNGIAGVTAARNIRKLSDHKITLISSESEHFFSRTALMYVYMGHQKLEHLKPYEDSFWTKNRIDLLKKHVENVDISDKKLLFSDNQTLHYDTLIFATGSRYRWHNAVPKDILGVQGFYSLQDLEKLEEISPNIKKSVIVGGGLIGVELAEMLHSRDIEVTILVRESGFWGNVLPEEEAQLVTKHIESRGVKILLDSEIESVTTKVLDFKNLGSNASAIKSIITKKGEVLPCDFLGLTIGVESQKDLATSAGIETNRGILVNEFLETSVKDVYAIGDCSELRNPAKGRKTIEPIWYTGKMMGETVAETICHNAKKYNPGIFFNSAKFFDLEYQTYGDIKPILAENESSFYWENSQEEKCLRINYCTQDKAVIGFNVFGIRFRQVVCQKWIAEKRTLAYVIEHLEEANFDPEFFKNYQSEIVAEYNFKFPEKTIKLKKNSGFWRTIFG